MTPERKQQLLLRARKDRIAWINIASRPFRTDSDQHIEKYFRQVEEDRIPLLQSLSACRSLPSAPKVLCDLYKENHRRADAIDSAEMMAAQADIEERISQKVEESLTSIAANTDSSLLCLSASAGTNLLENKVHDEDATEGRKENFSSSYRDFIFRLQDAKYGELIRKMRSFVTSTREEIAQEEPKYRQGDDSNLAALASSMNNFIESVWEEFQSVLTMGTPDLTRQCLETFLYAHCHDILWPFVSQVSEDDDKDMGKRMCKLQFVTPLHLEIGCLSSVGGVDAESTQSGNEVLETDDSSSSSLSRCKTTWEDILMDPIESLQLLNMYISPGEILDCILGVYRGINDALSSTTSGIAPGADDVLPTFILVLLRAQPKEIMSILRFVECFAPQSSLHGERGYAFTSLFSAAQYVRHLDFDQLSGMSQCTRLTFSIIPEEKSAGSEHSEAPMCLEEGSDGSSDHCSSVQLSVKPSDIRAARQRGEATDLTWAQRFQQTATVGVASVGLNSIVSQEQIIHVSASQSLCAGCSMRTSHSKIVNSEGGNSSSSVTLLKEAEQINSGVKLSLEGRFDESMGVFRAALHARLIANITNAGASVVQERQLHDSSDAPKEEDDELMHRLAHLFSTLGHSQIPTDLYVYQRSIYDEGMSTFSDLFSVNEDDHAEEVGIILYYNMALVALQMKRFNDAFDYLYIALVEEKKAMKMDTRSGRMIPILHNIGRALYLLGHAKDSLAVFEAALSTEKNIQGGGNPLYLAYSKSCIACIRWRILQSGDTLDDIEKAASETKAIIRLHLDALNAKENILGKGHISVAASLNLLGCMYGDESLRGDKNVGKALEYFQRSLKIRRVFLPADHPDISQVLYNIARIHHSTGALNQALDLYHECLRGLQKTQGCAHRDVSATLLCVAWIYHDTERDEEALKWCEDALKSGKAAFGTNHEQIGMIWTLLGHVHQSLGERYESSDHLLSAMDAFSESLSTTKALYGENHPRFSSTLILIGDIQKTTANYDDALRSYQQALPVLKSCEKTDTFDLATTLNSLGYCFAMKGDLMDAVKMYTAAVNLQLEEGDERMVIFAHAFNSLGVIFTKLGKVELAREALQESERVKKKVLQTKALYSPPVVFEPRKSEVNLASQDIIPEKSADDPSTSEKCDGMKRIASRDSQLVAQLIGLDAETAKDNKPDSVLECFFSTLEKIRDDGKKKRATSSCGVATPLLDQ